MMVASVSAFGKGLDSAKAFLGGLQVKYNRGEAASFEESLVEESVGVPASFANPFAPASASASAVDVEVASYVPFGPWRGNVPLYRSDSPSPPPKPAEVIDLTTSTTPSPVQATSPPDEVESPVYSPASPASSPTPASEAPTNALPEEPSIEATIKRFVKNGFLELTELTDLIEVLAKETPLLSKGEINDLLTSADLNLDGKLDTMEVKRAAAALLDAENDFADNHGSPRPVASGAVLIASAFLLLRKLGA